MGCGASSQEPPPKKGFCFRVRLIGGLNLYNNGFGCQIPGTATSAFNFSGKSDPYCVLNCEGVNYTSNTILHDQNPVWNQDFYFNVPTRKPIVKISCFDKDALSGDDLLGECQVCLHGLVKRGEVTEMWMKLKGHKAKGEIGISVVECYRTIITAKQGIDLKAADTLTGSSDVFLTLNIGQQPQQKTAVKGWTLNPIWNQSFKFFIPYGIESQLEMTLWDKDTLMPDDSLGWCFVKLDGNPKAKPELIRVAVKHASGFLEYEQSDDTVVEAPDPGPVTSDIQKQFPPCRPTTCNFECRVVGAFNVAASDHDYTQDMCDAAAAEFYHEFRDTSDTSDPFARVECEGFVYDTHHLNGTLDPQWNTKFRFVAEDREHSVMKISIWDHDLVVNDPIGCVTLPLNQMKPGENTEMWSFLDRGRGEVGIELKMHYQLKVRVVECKDLPAKDMNGMCDPYVKLRIGEQEFKTRSIKDNRDPFIDEDFRWNIPTLKDQKLYLEVWDSDLELWKNKHISEDFIGGAEVALDHIAHGIINDLTIPLNLKASGSIRLEVTAEIPVPQSALDLLAQKGKEAFNSAVNTLVETKDFITQLRMPDFDNNVEAEYEPCDPKIDVRPRYTQCVVEVVAVRGMNCTSPIHIGVCVPLQGQRYKTKEYPLNSNIGEKFHFKVPSRKTGVIEFTIFESNKHSYTTWTKECHSKALLKLSSLNGGDGPIRGSPADDTWLNLSSGGQICVRVFELFRFNIRIKHATGLDVKADPYVKMLCNKRMYRTATVSKDPAKDRTDGIPGKPIWDEQFTIFSEDKCQVQFGVFDENIISDDLSGGCIFDLSQLRRGIPHEATMPLSKGKGELTVWFKEEEKMGMMDRMIDVASNAAKLAAGVAEEVGNKIAEGVASIGKAFGGIF